VPGSQSTKYSPISDCGRVSHVVSVRSESDERVARLAIELEVGDLARAHAGDLEVAALDQAEGVVELDPVLAGLRGAVLVAGTGRREHAADDEHEDPEDDREALHQLPGSTWVGLQLRLSGL
jgi:hypothetical protein